jgi:peptide methionine sulfoxide reductase MsrB
LIYLDWEDHSIDNSDRQMAVVMNGEDWDREAHTGHIFNDDELRQLNGSIRFFVYFLSVRFFLNRQNDMWSHSGTP